MMANFERQIIGEIPLHEAASFFVGMKQPVSREAQVKTASARMKSAAQQQIDKLLAGDMPEGKAGQFKPVNQIKEAAKKGDEPAGPGTGAAMGAAFGGVHGARRGHMKGVVEQTANMIRGALGHPTVPPAEMKKRLLGHTLKGGAKGLAAGAAIGGALGYANKKLHEGAGRGKKASARPAGMSDRQWIHEFYTNRMKYAAAKLGFGMNSPAGIGEPEANMEGGQPTPAASNLPAMPTGAASMAPPEGPIQDPIAARPTTAPTVPVNYMGAELIARAAQQANEVGFLRERLNAATEQNNMLNQHVQQIQGQLDEVNQTQQAAGDQIMQATNEAVAASTRALEHSMQAANMRIGIQKMREAMMELASQDPESMGTLAQQQAVQDEAAMQQQQVDAGAGAPGQTATPATAGGSPAAEAPQEGGSESASEGKSEGKNGTSVSIKTGARLPGGAILPAAVAGAGLAGLMANRQTGQGDAQRAQVGELAAQHKATYGGSFSKAIDLAQAKQRLAQTELAEQHPKEYTARSAIKGGLEGATLGYMGNHLFRALKQQGLLGKAL